MNNGTNHIEDGLIEAYVLGLASEAECTEIERLRKQNPEVDASIIKFELQLENKFRESGNQLPEAFKQQVKEQLSFLPEKEAGSIVKPRWSFSTYAAAASLVLLVGSGVYHLIQNKRIDDLSNQLTAAKSNTQPDLQSLFINPSITPVAMYGQGTHTICRCTLFWDKRTGKAKLMVHHLVPAPAGKNFQLWVTVAGKQVPAGTIITSDYSRMIVLENIPDGASEFLVTLEPKGNTSVPTLSELYLKGVSV